MVSVPRALFYVVSSICKSIDSYVLLLDESCRMHLRSSERPGSIQKPAVLPPSLLTIQPAVSAQ